MLVDEVPHSFMKKNYNYSHCPLKKRPFYYTSEDEEEAPEAIKGFKIILLLSQIFSKLFSCKIQIYFFLLFFFYSLSIYLLYILLLIHLFLKIKLIM